MEEITSSISVLRLFIRRRKFLLDVSDGVGRSNFFRYSLLDLTLPDRSWIIFVGCREEIFPCNIYPGCCVLDNGDPYSRAASDVDQVVRFVFPGILLVVLLPILDDYSNGCARARNLCTAAKIKIMGESSLVFTGLWFGTYVLFMRLPSEKYKIASWKNNDYEDLDDLLVYAPRRLLLKIAHVSLSCTICYDNIWY
jgi:hypothetical protein